MSARLRMVRAFAPGSVGNVGPGLDILGLALTGPGDRVRAELAATPGIVLRDPGGRELPTDAGRNTAGLAAREVLRRAGVERETGLVLSVEKGLPLAAGQGGSAASAVAAAVAVNHLLGNPLSRQGLLEACLTAEEAVAGRHADNVAPSLLGGIVLIRSLDPIDAVSIPVPENLVVVLALPDQQLKTRDGRSVLPEQVSRSLALH
ncbi:MAG: homoserine kinase, partial [Gemmatimonadales bacterium]